MEIKDRIDILEKLIPEIKGDMILYSYHEKTLDFALEVLRKIEDGTYRKAGGWISVDEDIPMIGVHVILANGVEVLTGYLDCKMVWRRDNDYVELKNATDWQPLPKLPKGAR